jgi:transposase
VALLLELRQVVGDLRAEVVALRAENARLREELAKKGDPPSWAKPKTPKPAEQPERKRRGRGYGRACVAEPTATVEHAVDVCPDCGQPLTGGWVYSSHEVIDLPVQPATVTRHVRLMRQCGVCGRRVVPARAELADGSVGQHRFSARVMSLVAYWHHRCRLPLHLIQQTLHTLTGGLQLALGELRALLEAVADRGQATYDALKEEIRGSPVVQADETSWREDGQHGYVWAFLTPTARYFERHGTRSSQVPLQVLGEAFTGIVTCDGYKGYDPLPCEKQRCWVHLLRHGHRLRTKYPEAAEAHVWVDGLTEIYQAAVALVATPGYAALPEAARLAHRLAFQQRVQAHAAPHRQAVVKEWANLATFLTDYVNELFVFVQHPVVPSHNNGAERAVRRADQPGGIPPAG